MKNTILKLQILLRSELALSRIYLRRTIIKVSLLVVAILFLFLALCMLNIAGYHLLLTIYGGAMAAFWISIADLVLALIVILCAVIFKSHKNEEIMAKEMRDLAYNELNADTHRFSRILEDANNSLGLFTSIVNLLKKDKKQE